VGYRAAVPDVLIRIIDCPYEGYTEELQGESILTRKCVLSL
jgi:hypothetical protein